MNNRSGATLFLMEQTVAIAVFAVCAAICVAILVESHLFVVSSNDKGAALQAAQSAAECFKAAGGDAKQAADILRGGSGNHGNSVFYDKNWHVCADDAAAYVLTFTRLQPEAPSYPQVCEISVKESGGDEIIAFTVAARGKAS